MSKLRAIFVDDEESARDVLSNLLERFCPEVQLVSKCESMQVAIERITALEPDLVFLDIEMPNYAGYEIVNFIKEINFEIIFVTAYDQYAVRAFEIAAIDYLLKPIDIVRLQAAVSRVSKQREVEKQLQRINVFTQTLESNLIKNIIITDRGQQHVMAVEKIIAIEAQESYCIIHTDQKQLLASKNLMHFENLLKPVSQFFRVHKSWIINKSFIKSYSRSELSILLESGILAKLSKYKKAEFEDSL
jgi:two-component system LytT family response regulator